jgi:hypothetical protein
MGHEYTNDFAPPFVDGHAGLGRVAFHSRRARRQVWKTALLLFPTVCNFFPMTLQPLPDGLQPLPDGLQLSPDGLQPLSESRATASLARQAGKWYNGDQQ